MSRGSIFVTGASSGIGAAIALDLARRGFTVGCISRRGTAPEADGIRAFQGDVSDRQSVAAAIEALLAEGQPLVGVVNSAGYAVEGESVSVALDDARAIMETNFFGTWLVCQVAQPHLVAAGGGTIVNIGSFYDRLGVPRNVAYAASKAAIGSLTRCLAVEWARYGVRVLNVAPGYVETEINEEFFADDKLRGAIERKIPLRRFGQSEEIGRFVGGIYEDNVGFLTGETIYVDGGQGMAL
jgi:NAD(P)-dependent dehydrogenase (short-subunit alcohol dehydrogenase family)